MQYVQSRFPELDPQALPLFPDDDGLPVTEQITQQTVVVTLFMNVWADGTPVPQGAHREAR